VTFKCKCGRLNLPPPLLVVFGTWTWGWRLRLIWSALRGKTVRLSPNGVAR
jgi:hypothetical protein